MNFKKLYLNASPLDEGLDNFRDEVTFYTEIDKDLGNGEFQRVKVNSLDLDPHVQGEPLTLASLVENGVNPDMLTKFEGSYINPNFVESEVIATAKFDKKVADFVKEHYKEETPIPSVETPKAQ